MITIPSKVKYISYAGIIPILTGVVGSFDLSLMGNNINNWLVELGMLFSAIILSFLGGCLFIFETHSLRRPIGNAYGPHGPYAGTDPFAARLRKADTKRFARPSIIATFRGEFLLEAIWAVCGCNKYGFGPKTV